MAIPLALAGGLAVLATTRALAADPGNGQGACRRDLEFIPGFLLENDTGAPEHLMRLGGPALDKAMAEARDRIAADPTGAECRSILKSYARAWRLGHIDVSPAPGKTPGDAATLPAEPPARPGLASLRWLSDKTVLVTLPTFDPAEREHLEALLVSQRRRLDRTPNWILDIRDNDGGSDSTYASLLDAIVISPRVEVGAEFLSTPANIANTQGVCRVYQDKSCEAAVAPLVSAMKAARPGDYVRPPGVTEAVSVRRDHRAPREAPRRVGVVIDQACASSCEQFVLSVRQSYNVKLFGRRTAGSLDYSNLRPQVLPSGERLLWYATSRSLRLPHLPVDAAGIPPDVYLPPAAAGADPAAEIVRVRAWLEAP
ncbi:S41 family peptidase [Phenylobacterium sp.]|uniref:S41 family peptidase n=1 Tax=Phenylobacterium sp. TaxID=1871053 RepID=UPI0037C601C9